MKFIYKKPCFTSYNKQNKLKKDVSLINNITNNNVKKNLQSSKQDKSIIKKCRNSELTENKKYCNHPRSRNKGPCKIIIYKYEK